MTFFFTDQVSGVVFALITEVFVDNQKHGNQNK